eukprot:jgi/Bigna1/35899/e_gw1.11.26.1
MTSRKKLTGNTCYMNAAVQCLATLTPLMDEFLARDPVTQNKSHFFPKYFILLLLMQILASSFTYICPEYLKALIEHVRPEFKGNEQHDCQEFTQALLDELNCDLKRIEKKPKAKSVALYTHVVSVSMSSVGRSVISEMFFGMTQNRVECQTCFKRSTVYSTFSTIPQVDGNGYHSSMDPGDETKTLHQCFQDFTKEERLSGSNAYFCSRCNKRGDATCRMMFYHLPPVLIIHLKVTHTTGREGGR